MLKKLFKIKVIRHDTVQGFEDDVNNYCKQVYVEDIKFSTINVPDQKTGLPKLWYCAVIIFSELEV